MIKKWMAVLALVMFAVTGIAGPVKADGIIIPPPPCEGRGCPPPPPRPMTQLVIRYHHVEVEIADQLATTRVDQVFINSGDEPIEGTYIFPLPVDAAVSKFSMWVDGKVVEGKVLDAETARRIYEDTVSNLRDPALLEYIGRGAVQASVFPIPAQGEQHIQLEYSQVLTADNGLVRYVYPLNTEKFSLTPLESVSVTVRIRSQKPVRAVYSPSHKVDVIRSDDQNISASYEENNVTPDTDFSLYYSVGLSEAFHLMTYRDPENPGDPDGFFMMLLAPKPGQVDSVVAKDVLLVLDHSGSMEGEKFQQAQAALRYILENLNQGDRFHITTFSTGVEMYSTELQPAGMASDAVKWVSALSAAGSTDINRALLEAASVADPRRPTYLIFLTDGLPTEGITDSDLILNNFESAARDNLRLFAFGVGYDVDTFLLDSLSAGHHGLSSYVQPGQALDEALSGFYARISTPVLTNLRLDFGDLEVYDVYPNPLPDLFTGTQVVVTGRYRGGGRVDVSLYGMVNERSDVYRYPQQGFIEDSRAIRAAPVGLPRLWATRKIGTLLNQIRLKGPDKETIDQVVKLSIRYGIVTPYTSYLVNEDMPLGAGSQERLAQDAYDNAVTQAPAAPSGQEAVQKAADQGAMSQAEAPAQISQEAGQRVRVAGSKTFVESNGVWIDTAFDPESMTPIPVAFLSPDYYRLASANPETAAALAVSEQVIVVSGGSAYQVISEGSDAPPLAITPQPSPVETNTPHVIMPTAVPTEAPQADGKPAVRQLGWSFYLFSCLGGLITLGAGLWAFKRR